MHPVVRKAVTNYDNKVNMCQHIKDSLATHARFFEVIHRESSHVCMNIIEIKNQIEHGVPLKEISKCLEELSHALLSTKENIREEFIPILKHTNIDTTIEQWHIQLKGIVDDLAMMLSTAEANYAMQQQLLRVHTDIINCFRQNMHVYDDIESLENIVLRTNLRQCSNWFTRHYINAKLDRFLTRSECAPVLANVQRLIKRRAKLNHRLQVDIPYFVEVNGLQKYHPLKEVEMLKDVLTYYIEAIDTFIATYGNPHDLPDWNEISGQKWQLFGRQAVNHQRIERVFHKVEMTAKFGTLDIVDTTLVTKEEKGQYQNTIRDMIHDTFKTLKDLDVIFPRMYEKNERKSTLQDLKELDTVGQCEALIQQLRQRLEEMVQAAHQGVRFLYETDNGEKAQYFDVLHGILDKLKRETKKHGVIIRDREFKKFKNKLSHDLGSLESSSASPDFLGKVHAVCKGVIKSCQEQAGEGHKKFPLNFDFLYEQIHASAER